MSKAVATSWRVVVNSVDLSANAFNVSIADTKEKIDVSGFNATRTKEFVPGSSDQSVTVQFIQDRASGKVHQTIYPLYSGGSVFPFYVLPDSTAGTSGSNPLYGGSASVFSYPTTAALNAREEVSIEFAPASGSSFAWGTVAP